MSWIIFVLLTFFAAGAAGLIHQLKPQSKIKSIHFPKSVTQYKMKPAALVTEFPWVVGLRSSFGSFFCSGFLIQPDCAVTTSRCLVTDVREVSQGIDEENTRDVIHKVIHPNYRVSLNGTHHITSLQNDVGLLFLHKMFTLLEFEERVYPVAQNPITVPYVDYHDQYVAIFGYGNHEAFPKVLPKKIRLYIDRCKTDNRFRTTFCYCKLNENVEESAYCFAGAGTPVVVKNIIIGLATMAPSDCERSDVVAFNGIYEHLPWIYFTSKLFKSEFKLLASASAALRKCLLLNFMSVLHTVDNI